MKLRRPVALSAFLAAVPGFLQAVQPGDTRTTVLAELGQPTGLVAAGPAEILVYERGEVRLRNGVVQTIRLSSAAELAIQRDVEAKRAERIAQLATEGRTVRAERKSDPEFARLPAAEQLAFWRSFATRYPMVSVADELAVLQARVAAAEQQRESEWRLAALEARLADTEAQAARAEQAAQQARHRRFDHDHFSHGYIPLSGFHAKPIDDCGPDEPPPSRPRREIPVTPRGQAMGDYERSRSEIYTRSIY